MSNIYFRQVQFLAIIILGIACSGAGLAAETQIDLELEEIYSSNITLVPNDIAFSDFVTRINPSFLYTKDGRVIDFSVDYNYEIFIYARNSDLNQDFHQLDTSALVHVIGDELTVSGQAIYTQVNIDPARPPADSNISVTGNRSNGLYWGITPQWQRQLPLNSIIDVNYTFGRISFDDPGIQELDTQTLAFRLASDPAAGLSTTYELNYNYWFFDYETTGSIRDQNLYFSLGQEIGYGFSLIGLVGLDSNFADPENSTLSEGRWEVGFESADEDGHLRAMIGRRYFGTVLRFSVGHTFSDWYFSASYLEEPGTSESVFLQTGGTELPASGGPSTPEPPPPSGIDRPGSAARFLRKRLDGIVQWEGRRSEINFTTWWDQRDNLSGNPGAGIDLPADDESVGAVLSYAWEIGGHTTASLTSSWIHRKFTEADDQTVFDEIDVLQSGAGISYLLGLKTSLGSSLTYRKSQGDATGDNYTEFQAAINLTRSF